MGFYTQIATDKNLAAKNVAEYNYMNGNYNYCYTPSDAIIDSIPSIFFALTGKVAEFAADRRENRQENNSIERSNLEKDLQEALNDIGASDENNINEAVTEKQNKYSLEIQTAQAAVNVFTDGQDEYSSQITSLKVQISGLNEQNDPDGVKKAQLEQQIADLEAKKAEAYSQAQSKLQEIQKTAEVELKKIETRAKDAFNILEKLAKLDSSSEKKVNVKEKTEALYDFTQTRTAFEKALKNNNTNEARVQAETLKKIYEEHPNDKTIRNAYEKLLKTKVEQALK